MNLDIINPITGQEAAEILKVDIRTIYQLFRKGRLKHTRLRDDPASWRTTKEWLNQYLEEFAVKPRRLAKPQRSRYRDHSGEIQNKNLLSLSERLKLHKAKTQKRTTEALECTS